MTAIILTKPLLRLPTPSHQRCCPHQAMAGHRHHTLSLFLLHKTGLKVGDFGDNRIELMLMLAIPAAPTRIYLEMETAGRREPQGTGDPPASPQGSWLWVGFHPPSCAHLPRNHSFRFISLLPQNTNPPRTWWWLWSLTAPCQKVFSIRGCSLQGHVRRGQRGGPSWPRGPYPRDAPRDTGDTARGCVARRGHGVLLTWRKG